MLKIRYLLLLTIIFCSHLLNAQCFQVKDGNGVNSSNPYFISCTPTNFTVYIQPDQTIGPYVIDWGDGSPNTTGASLNPSSPVQHTYTATTDTFDVTITDQSTSCVVNGVVVLERNPLASIQLPSGDDNFGCTPVQFRFINSSTQISQTTTFTWDFGDGSPIKVYDYTNLGDTIYHTYMPGIGVQSCDLEVTLTATNYCGSSTASFYPLKVWDLDEAVITPSDDLLCYPDTVVQYTNNTIRNCYPEGNNSQRYEKWNFGDYWGLGHDSIIDWRPWNPPLIDPPPMAYPGIGTYTVTLIDSSFCGLDTTSIDITITSPPTADITASKDSICAGESVTFINNSSGGANEYSWNFGKGGGWQNISSSNKTRSFNSPGDYTIQLAIGVAGASGCTDTADVKIHVLPAPAADFSFDNNNACDSMKVNFTDQTSGSVTSWEWRFGNGNTYIGQNPPTQNYTSIGRHRVTLITESKQGCIDSISKDIFVRETPNAGFDVSGVCLNFPANFIDQSTSPIDPVTSYKWYFGDGDSATTQDPSHLYTAYGTYTVIQIVDNGYCSDSDTMEVIVEQPPTAAFTADTLDGCSRLNVNFTNQSSSNATKFRWNFGDGSAIDTNRNPMHEFSNTSSQDTSFEVTLIAQTTFGCADTISDSVTVYPVPRPSFTSDAVADCGPIEVNFTNTTIGSNLNYYWNFGDGSPISTAVNPTHIFENKTLFISNYEVELVVESANGCRDTSSQIVTVNPEPDFSFGVTPDSACSPLTVQFPSVVGAVSYQWDFGDSTTGSGATPRHTYVNNTTNNKTYQVRLIAQNSFGCEDTTYHNILVYPNPTSDFVLDTNIGCQPLPVNITNQSIGANNYHWSFGDSTFSDTSAAIFTKTYTNKTQLAKRHTIKLITETTEGCMDTAAKKIEVHPFIQADFISDSVGCAPLKVNFQNRSRGASAFLWKYGDSASSSAASPSHIYRNDSSNNQSYLAEMIAVSPEGCRDTAHKNILVFPKPKAKYLLSDSVGCHPLNVNFSNQSQLADSCFWTFGDGSSIQSCSPINGHQYSNSTSFLPVNYESQLIVKTDDGCMDTTKKKIKVNPEVKADFTSDSVGCSPLKVRFNEQSQGAKTFAWTFGDGGYGPSRNPTHYYINSAKNDTTFTAKLKVTSAYGCVDSASQQIEVWAKPKADFLASPIDGCHPLPVNFVNQSSISDSCSWVFGDGNSSSGCGNLMTHTFKNEMSIVPVNYETELRVYTNKGCADTLQRNITVKPKVEADFTTDTIGCSPLEATFRSQSFGAVNYYWDFGYKNIKGSGIVTTNRYTNTGSSDSIYTARLIAESVYRCTDTNYQDILVRPTPIPDFVPTPRSQVFPNSTVSLTNNTNAGNWNYVWDFDDGDSSIFKNPNPHKYDRWGRYWIKLEASSQHCTDSVVKMIEIEVPQPIADFSDSAKGCEPLEVSFTNESKYGKNYEWDFGDGTTSTAENPNHLYFNAGKYDVSLKVQGYEANKEDRIIKRSYIDVYKSPKAIFFTNKDKVFIPNDPLVLVNDSRDADSYVWNFGDGNTSTEKSPVHYYKKEGEFPIYLVAKSNNGCRDTFNLPTKVIAELEGRIEVPNAFTPNPNGSNGGRVDPLNKANLNDVFYVKLAGVAKYELNIFNKWGELLFVSKDVNTGWDGYYRNELCKQDVYVYKVKVEFVDGKTVEKVGDLMLLR